MEDTQVQSKAKPRTPTPAPKPESTKHLRVLSNGAVYDMVKKRIVDSRNVTTKITKENAVALQSRQQELKRQALIRAANAVAAQGGGVDGREMQGDMAYVEAIGEAMTMKALTVNDPKAVDAARFIFQETGISAAQEQPAQPAQQPGMPTLVLLLSHLHEREPEAIDAQVLRSDILISNEVRIDEQDNGVIDASPTDAKQDGET